MISETQSRDFLFASRNMVTSVCNTYKQKAKEQIDVTLDKVAIGDTAFKMANQAYATFSAKLEETYPDQVYHDLVQACILSSESEFTSPKGLYGKLVEILTGLKADDY